MEIRTYQDEEGYQNIQGVDNGSINVDVRGKLTRNGKTAKVSSVWVAPKQRKQGHGTAAMTKFLQWAKDAGAQQVVVKIDPEPGSEAEVKAFYEKNGFTPGKKGLLQRSV